MILNFSSLFLQVKIIAWDSSVKENPQAQGRKFYWMLNFIYEARIYFYKTYNILYYI